MAKYEKDFFCLTMVLWVVAVLFSILVWKQKVN